jgi:nucleoside-diphosphate-sugar epimerase
MLNQHMANIKTLSNASRSVSILGANGFIGTAIVKNLMENGWKIEDTSVLDLANFKGHGMGDFIINCVGTASLEEDVANRVNSVFPSELAKIATRLGSALIHFGSSAEYAPSRNPIKEDSPTKDADIYSKTKLLGSQAIIDFGPEGKRIVLRPFGVIQRLLDPLPAHPSKLLSLIWKAQGDQELYINNPCAVRDLVGVNEIAKAVSKLVDSAFPWPKVLNVSSGIGHSMEEIISSVNPKVRINGEERKEIDTYVGDPGLLKVLLGFEFEKDFKRILFKTIDDNV